MKRVLILQHEPGDDLRQWRPLFERLGVSVRIVDFSRTPEARPTLRGFDGLILLGGSIDVHEAPKRKHLGHEMNLVRRAAGSGMPVLGICLGGQLVASALGAKVSKSKKPEIGWHRIEGLSRVPVLQWHSYEFGLPKGAKRLASSPACANQAFRLGSVVATQFHFEIDRRTIEDWLAASSSMPPARKRSILRGTKRYLPGSVRLGRRLFSAFLTKQEPPG